jgi:hypothetical protein
MSRILNKLNLNLKLKLKLKFSYKNIVFKE